MRRSSVIPAVLAAFMVTLAALASHVHAQAPPDSLPYVTSIRTIPAQPCDSIPTMIVLEGEFPTSCGRELGHSGLTMYVHDPYPSCARCMPMQVAWAETLEVGLLAAGQHAFQLAMGVVDFCDLPEDTTFHYARFEISVGTDCPPSPPPLDPMTYVTRVIITSASNPAGPICEGDSILLRVSGVLPDDCHLLRRIEQIPSLSPGGPLAVGLVFDNSCCTDELCIAYPTQWEASLVLPPGSAPSEELTLVAFEVCCRDSVQPGDPHGRRDFWFRVYGADSCGVEPPPITCLWPTWLHDQTSGCDAYVSKTGPAEITGMVHTTVALAGIQGEVHAIAFGTVPLSVHSIEPIGPAAGMHLTWEPIANGAKFVLFADQGAPLLPTSPRRPTQFLKIRWSLPIRGGARDSMFADSTRWRVAWSDVFGSDIRGNLVPLCPSGTPGIFADVATICTGQPGACDMNGDAQADVRDLVLMAHCLNSPGNCPWTVTSLDCDGDLDSDFDDLYCCARVVLGIPPCADCPDDSVRVEPRIAFSFGTPVQTPAGIEIPLRIHQPWLIGAARFSFSLPPELIGRAWIDMSASNWLPVSRGNGSGIEFGIIRLPSIDLGLPLHLDGTLHIAVDSGTRPSGQIRLDQVQISGHDGVMLKTDLGTPVVRLGAGLGVSLSAARPNPFGASTTFRLTLDAPADAADLAVYDLSGRRITTVHKGPLAIGSHAFTWNGRAENGSRAKAGVYFVRASVGGKVTNQKLVMLRE